MSGAFRAESVLFPLLAVLLVILLCIPGPLLGSSFERYHGKLSASRTRVSWNTGWQGAVISQICNSNDIGTDRLCSKHAFPIFLAAFIRVLPVYRCRRRALGLHLKRSGNAALSSSVKSFATVDMDGEKEREREKSHKFITVFQKFPLLHNLTLHKCTNTIVLSFPTPLSDSEKAFNLQCDHSAWYIWWFSWQAIKTTSTFSPKCKSSLTGYYSLYLNPFPSSVFVC